MPKHQQRIEEIVVSDFREKPYFTNLSRTQIWRLHQCSQQSSERTALSGNVFARPEVPTCVLYATTSDDKQVELS